jgi:murein DD-endopeptidase MepM/ murein hydrolase activator NlpD
MYAHMSSPSPLHRGARVRTGQRIGRVGKTGNARTTPCHLHFEIWPHGWRQGSPIDPKPSLRRWDGWS